MPRLIAAALVCLLAARALSADPAPTAVPPAAEKPVAIIPAAGLEGFVAVRLGRIPADGRVAIPTPTPNIVSAHAAMDFPRPRLPLRVEFSPDASLVTLWVDPKDETHVAYTLEYAEKSGQRPDGRIIFVALDAKVVKLHSDKPTPVRAKLETHPGNHRIGFWSDHTDAVTWDHDAGRPGMYDVELTYSRAGGADAEVAIDFAGVCIKGRIGDTGSFYRYTTVPMGRLYVAKAGKTTLTVASAQPVPGAGALMNLKAVILRPACEGKPVVQAEDGSVTLHARDVTLHSVKAQWEPNPAKQTVGYWVNEKDQCYWDFEVKAPGKFSFSILQGCGKGNGGSEVEFDVAGATLKHIVEDTGHFQNFVPKTLGEVTLAKPGRYRVWVRPMKKAKAAVMDLREVRLAPVK